MSTEPLRRVLVTGGAGYIGSHIVLTLLLTRRYKVISIDNHHNSYPESLKRVQEIARDALPSGYSEKDYETTQVDAISADLTVGDQIRGVFEKYGKGGVWGVIHVAAYKAVGESSEIPLAYYSNNVSATILLSQIMHEFDCTRMVYSSSATVYGTPPVIPIPETTPLKADSVYGRTKVMCEMILQDLCHAEPEKWRVISLRYFNPAGAHPSGRIGEDPRGRPGNLLPLLSQMAIGRVKDVELKVFGNDFPTPDGTCVRDYLHVMDLSAGHLLAMDALVDASHPAFQNLPDRAKYKAYNLGKGRGQSVFNIVDAMRKASGVNFKTRVIGRRLGDVPDLTADPSLAERELGFHAAQDLETMCRDLWNWQTQNPEGYATPQPPSSPPGAPVQDWVNVQSSMSDTTPSSTVVEDADDGAVDIKDIDHEHVSSCGSDGQRDL
ncbi:UDP-glucose-4-epimerase [Tulasnella sp. 419]|nr:UDP-glucose-4-epimerase [Tulasnella sp. 418]KAG8961338.1 UDP-glucose-4-epimerase [Tulasnella sp. 419]